MSILNYKNYDMTFSRKGYGRFFVETKEDIEKVKSIMREIDEDEFECYYPSGNYFGGGEDKELITTFSPENFKSVYIGKFDDMDMGLVMKKAWEQGIKCFCVFGKCNEFDED